MHNTNETWCAISGYEGSYEASDAGAIRSLTRTNSYGRTVSGKILKAYRKEDGHLQVWLHRDGVRKGLFVHRLVLMAFVGAAPAGTVACHQDGNASNNRIGNLRWDTNSSNQIDRINHGYQALKGEECGASVLTEQQAISIRGDRRGLSVVAREFGISAQSVWMIRTGRSWKHLGVDA